MRLPALDCPSLAALGAAGASAGAQVGSNCPGPMQMALPPDLLVAVGQHICRLHRNVAGLSQMSSLVHKAGGLTLSVSLLLRVPKKQKSHMKLA